ncbi:MAG: radical SAM protein [bacterium]|nr:radical SAM protein [bacterium]
MKICLIIPPSSFLMDERVFMTLGILKVAASLEQAGISVDVLDLSGFKNFEDIARDYVIQKTDICHFGLTATTPQLPATVKITQAIRNVRKDVKIILGGPHATLVNTAYRKEILLGKNGRAVRAMAQLENLFDVIVAGDGEQAIFAALEKKSSKIVDADKVGSNLFLTDQQLTDSPWPARHLVDVSSYHYTIDGVSAISLIAQLGCPFGCGFCGGRESPTFRRIRMRTSEDIVAEMVHLHQTYGFNGFMMYDDELNVNTKMIELMQMITRAQRDLGVEWRLRGFIKSQLLTDAQAEAMHSAGFRWILVGFESGSEEILTAINKKATRAENTRCMEIARRHGLKVKALMSMGHPGETRETIEASRQWLLEVKPDDFDVAVITAYPGTPYYDHAIPHPNTEGVWIYTYQPTQARLYQQEIDFSKVAEYYKGDPDGGYRAFVYTDALASEDIVIERNRLESDVRRILGIPFNKGVAAMRYEHSMGQGFPTNILRTTA